MFLEKYCNTTSYSLGNLNAVKPFLHYI